MIEYAYIANMVNALITYGHGGKIKRMKKKYRFFMEEPAGEVSGLQGKPLFRHPKAEGTDKEDPSGRGAYDGTSPGTSG